MDRSQMTASVGQVELDLIGGKFARWVVMNEVRFRRHDAEVDALGCLLSLYLGSGEHAGIFPSIVAFV